MLRALSMFVFGHPADRTGRRSSQWPAVRRVFLAANPTCAACGGKENLTPHHVKPFHLYPELELEPSNLIALCEGSVFNCHLFFGHLGNWESYNPDVRKQARIMLNARQLRPKSLIWTPNMEHQTTVRAIPFAEWHEDVGPALWWSFPITEPPYVGTPNDQDWPGYPTHFTSIPLPSGPRDGAVLSSSNPPLSMPPTAGPAEPPDYEP